MPGSESVPGSVPGSGSERLLGSRGSSAGPVSLRPVFGGSLLKFVSMNRTSDPIPYHRAPGSGPSRLVPSLLAVAWVILALGLAGTVPPARAQPEVVGITEDLDFDRPESWAMKYFANVTQLTALGAPRERRPGEVEIAVEGGWIPHLDVDERRVGFNGTKTEDLNKLAAFARPRITVGLGGGFSLTAAWIPPVELEGVEANLLALALERPLAVRGPWGLGARLYGQSGEVEGDFTCTDEDLVAPPGEPGNEFGCQAPSEDSYDLTTLGLELVGSYDLRGERAPQLHFATAANYQDLEFQVDALRFGFRDRNLLRTDGWTWSAAAGATWSLGEAARLATEVFYAPLEVDRPGSGRPDTENETDALLNARLMVGFTVR